MQNYNELDTPSKFDEDSQLIHRIKDLNILSNANIDLEKHIRTKSDCFVKEYKDFFELNGSDKHNVLINIWNQDDDELEEFLEDYILSSNVDSNGSNALKHLREALDECYINLEEVGKKWINKEQKRVWLSFNKLKDAGIFQDDVKQVINVLQRSKLGRLNLDVLGHKTTIKNGIEEGDRKKVVANLLKRDILNHGKFLSIQEELHYYVDETKEIYKIDKREPVKWLNFLSNKYGLSNSSTKDRYIIDIIENHGRSVAEDTMANRLFYWDQNEMKLYVSNKGKYYYELDGKSIEKRFNGQNGIFFLDNYSVKNDKKDVATFEYIPPELRDNDIDITGTLYDDNYSAIEKLLINRTNFEHKTALNEDEQRMQLMSHLYTLPFYTSIETKPIMTFVGEKNSGKSSTMNMLGKFFLKTDYKVSSLSGDEKDFYVAVVNSLLYFLDNVDNEDDEPADWLQDALAKTATGAEIRKRQLYKDTQEVRVKPDCFLGITSRSPYFKRDDVVDRMLVFHVKRVESEIDEDPLVEPIRNNYDELWSLYLERLNEVVAEIRDRGEEFLHEETNHRLAAWVIFSRIIGDALDLNENVRSSMENKMRREKAMFTLEDENITKAIDKWISSMDFNEGKKYKASELAEMWNKNDNIDYNGFSPNWVGRNLSKLKDELSTVYGMQRSKGPDSGYRYEFHPSNVESFDTKHGENNSDEKEEDDSDNDVLVFSEENRKKVKQLVKNLRESQDTGVKRDELAFSLTDELELDDDQVNALLDKMIKEEEIFFDNFDEKVRIF